MAYRSADGGYGAGASVFHLDSSHPDYIVIPDAELLFHGVLHRAGPDLRLTGEDGRHHIIPGYFASEKHPALVTPSGARLSADLVDLLAGSPAPGQYAQANAPLPPDAIGKVEKVVGNVEVIRNGTAVALSVGDAVYKSDIIQTGANSQCGIDFPDGTALNLVSNTRMALNDYSYDPSGTSNNAAFSILQGAFGFVAGKVAHTGDMNIATPVATMGIRGTIGTAQQLADATWAFTVDDGVYVLLDVNGQILERVYRVGYHTLVHRESSGTYTVTTEQMTSAEQQLVQEIVRDVIRTLELFNNPNPQSNPNPGSSTPPDQIEHLQLLLLENGSPVFVNVNVFVYQGGAFSPGANGGHLPQNNQGGSGSSSTTFIWNGDNGPNWDISGSWNLGSVPTDPSDNVVVPAGTGTPNYNNSSGTPITWNSLTVDPGAEFDVSQGTLNVSHGVIDNGVIVVGGDPPTLTISGLVAIGSGASLVARHHGEIDLDNASITNDGLIAATHRGKIVFDQSDLTNEETLKANHHGTISFDSTGIDNQSGGKLLATDDGSIRIDDSNVINADDAAIGAIGQHSDIDFSGNSVDNSGAVFAADHAAVSFHSEMVTNESGGWIGANDGTIAFKGGGVNNAGTIEADHCGTIVFASIGAGFNGNPIDVTNSITNPDTEIAAGGTIKATNGGIIKFLGDEGAGSVDNDYGVMEATRHGTLLFVNIAVSNSDGGMIEAKDSGKVVIKGDGGAALTDGDGTIAAIGRDSTVDIVDDTTIYGAINEPGGSFQYNVVGTLEADGGTLFVSCDSNLFGPIDIDISNGGLAHFADVVNANDAAIIVAFSGGGTLQLDQAPSTDVSATPVTLSDFWVGDTLDLTNLAYSPHETVSDSGGVLTVTDGGTSESFSLAGSEPDDFVVVNDGSGGTDVVYADTWTNASGGSWTASPDNWSSGFPSARDTVLINLPVTVTLDERRTVENLMITACATLDIAAGGSLHVLNELQVTGGALDVEGLLHAALTNFISDSRIAVSSTGTIDPAVGSTITFDRSHVHVGNDGVIGVYPAAGTSDGTIIFDHSNIYNDGFIDAAADGKVTFDHSHVDNQLSIIAYDGGTIKFEHSHVDTSWEIGAASGGTVTFDHSDVNNEGIGGINASDGTITFLHSSVRNAESIEAQDGGAITFDHSHVDNDGWIGASDTSTITFDHSRIENDGYLVANVFDDPCGGTVTIDHSYVDNKQDGLIGAEYGGALTIDCSSVDNCGTIGAGLFGTITVEDSIVCNADGTIEATGYGAAIQLFDSTIDGGTLTSAHGGYFEIDSGACPVIFAGVTLSDGSIVDIDAGATLALDCTTTLQDGAEIFGPTGFLNNSGTISVTCGDSASLVIDEIVNCGAIAAYDGGTLDLSAYVDNYGTIAARGTDSVIGLNNSVIFGGALFISCGATVDVGGSGAFLSGVNVIDNGTLEVNGGFFALDPSSSICGSGDIVITGGGAAALYGALNSDLSVTFSGDGTLALSSAPVGTLTITGFGYGDAIDLINLPFDPGNTSAILSGDTLTVTAGSSSETFDLAGEPNGSVFTVVNDATGVTMVLYGTEDEWTKTSHGQTAGGAWGGNGGANWSGGAPSATENAVVDKPGTYTITLAGGNETVNNLTISDADATLQGFGTINGGIVNAGTIEASGGTLTLDGNVLNGDDGLSAGTLSAASGSTLKLEGNGIDNLGNIAVSGTLLIDAAGGILSLDSSSSTSFVTGTVTLAGGSITAAAGQTLANWGNTIEGYGHIGHGTGNLTLDNFDGTIDATVSGKTLTIDTGNGVFNAGTLEATCGGILQIDDSLANDGTIKADGGIVDLNDVSVENSGTIEAVLGGNINFDGVEMTGGALTIACGSAVNVGAPGARLSDVALTDNGTLNVNGGFFVVRDDSTVSGDGSINITGAGTAVFYDALDSNLSVNFDIGVLALDAAPSGGPLNISNFGTGDALNLLNVPFTDSPSWSSSGGSSTLTIDGESFTFSGDGSSNNFTLVSDGTGGTVVLFGTEDEWVNPTGTRPWSGPNNATNWSTGSTPSTTDNVVVDLPGTYTITVSGGVKMVNTLTISDPDATLQGFGTLEGGIINAGTIVASGGTLTLNEDVLNSGNLWASSGNTLKLEGIAIENVGTITVDGTLSIDASGGVLALDSGNGAGAIILSGGSIDAAASGQTLVNLGNTISGYGTIGDVTDNHLTLDNSNGTIDADVSGQTLGINTGANALSNEGLLEATNGGILEINQVDNSGVIEANGGGTLNVQDSINNTGRGPDAGILIDANSTLLINGFNPDFGSNPIIANTVSFTGGGNVTLTGGTITENAQNSLVTDSGAVLALDNVDNTISGYGTIGSGDGHFVLTNETGGTIDANFVGETLTIDTGNTVTNTGTFEASNGGTLQVDDPVTGGGNGLVEGGTVNFAAAAAVNEITFNNGNGTPAYGEVSFGDEATLNGLNATINGFAGTAANAASSDEIDLAGVWTTSSSLTGNGENLLVTLTDGGETATLTFANFDSMLKISNNGTDTFIFDPPANTTGASVSVGQDHFVFGSNFGHGGSNTGAPEFEHLISGHAEDWTALVADTNAGAAAEMAAHADAAAHWHAAAQHAFHLH